MRRLLIVALLSVAARAESAAQHQLEVKLHERIRAFDAQMGGVLGVATIDLTSGRVYVYNGDVAFPTASTIKIAILAELFRAKVPLNSQVTVQPGEAVGGAGRFQERLKSGPVTATVRELATAMIVDSDNTATNQCIKLAGMERVNRTLASLGMRQTRLRRVMMDTAAAARGDENTTTPLEMARLTEMLNRGRLGSEEDTRQMLGILKMVKAEIRRVVPESIEVASKPGDLTGVHCETAIVYLPGRPFVVSVYSTFLDAEANPVGGVARMVFDYFEKLSASNQYGNRVK